MRFLRGALGLGLLGFGSGLYFIYENHLIHSFDKDFAELKANKYDKKRKAVRDSQQSNVRDRSYYYRQ